MNHPAELISSPASMGGDEEKRMEMEWNGMKWGERLCFEDTRGNKRDE
jgi:hypothetical protein